MGRLADRFGIMRPIMLGALVLGAGFVAGGLAASYWQFVLVQALLIGMLGSSATFGPLIADVSHWFVRQRGIAVAIVASGSYLAGTFWPPVLTYAIETIGWRHAYMAIGAACVATMVPLALLLRAQGADPPCGRADAPPVRARPGAPVRGPADGVAGARLLRLLRRHVDAAGAPHRLLRRSRLRAGARGRDAVDHAGDGRGEPPGSGLIADRIGGVGTLILGSTLQCLALVFYLPFDGLASLYVVSALFGLAQGGIVPSYALIVRDYFPAREAGARVSLVLMASVIGMAVGGWVSGGIYDLTRSYQAAFLNGIAWNLLNMAIAFWLLMGRMRAREEPGRIARPRSGHGALAGGYYRVFASSCSSVRSRSMEGLGSKSSSSRELADLDLALLVLAVRRGGTLSPFDGLFPGLHLDQPVAGDRSLASVKGPSITMRWPPEKRTRAPFEVGCRPVRSSSTPAFASASLYLVIASRSLSSGMTPASVSLFGLHDHHEPHRRASWRHGARTRRMRRPLIPMTNSATLRTTRRSGYSFRPSAGPPVHADAGWRSAASRLSSSARVPCSRAPASS